MKSELVAFCLAWFAADVNDRDHAGDSALVLAVKGHSGEIAGLLLEQENLDINATNNEGKSALMVAAELGELEIVRMLCERPDIDYDIMDNDVCFWRIWFACCSEYLSHFGSVEQTPGSVGVS